MKTALITGGAQGIGKGIVTRLRADGWRVAIFDMDAQALDQLGQIDPDLLCLPVDVSDEGQVAQGMLAVQGWLGQGGLGQAGLDLLVANAGLADPVSGPIEDLSLRDWRRWQDSHVTGAFLTIRGAVPLLRQAQGSIVTMSSTRAFQSESLTEAYATAKGALVAMTHALAVSLGPQIRVNCILPGWIETRASQGPSVPRHSDRDHDQHPVGRVGTVDDIAGMVAWLASSEAGFITGQRFVVDGGMSVRMIYAD